MSDANLKGDFPNPEAQAEVEAMIVYDRKHSDECRDTMTREGHGRKTNRAHARAELEALRVELAEEARLDNYITVLVQRNVKTGSDVVQVLQGLKSMGVSYDGLAHYANIVWPDH